MLKVSASATTLSQPAHLSSARQELPKNHSELQFRNPELKTHPDRSPLYQSEHRTVVPSTPPFTPASADARPEQMETQWNPALLAFLNHLIKS